MYKYSGEQWIVPQNTVLHPDIGSIAIAPGREIATGLKDRLQQADQVFWLVDEKQELGTADVDKGAESYFVNVEKWQRGRRDSLQGVFFGRLAVGQAAEVAVAVKPFLSAVGPGMHEMALQLYLESMGLPVYRVLGASWTNEQGFAMITAFEEESKSLDNVDWSKGLDAPLGEHLTNLEAIKQIGHSLGMLHGNGVVHFDSQIKNFAVVRDQIRLIDLAQSRLMLSDSYCDELSLETGMFRDISRLLESLIERGFLRDSSKEEWKSFFDNVIAPAYRSGLYLTGTMLKDKYGVNHKAMVERVISMF